MLRLFIAINIPEFIKEEIQKRMEKLKISKRYRSFHPRLTTFDQWHLTLIFLGSQLESEIPKINQAMISWHNFPGKEKIKISFSKITYGPPGSKARMIWLVTKPETSLILARLKNFLEKELEKQKVIWPKEKREFQGHVTLVRFNKIIEKKYLPELEEDFEEDFELENIDLMKSTLKKEGALYEKIFSV